MGSAARQLDPEADRLDHRLPGEAVPPASNLSGAGGERRIRARLIPQRVTLERMAHLAVLATILPLFWFPWRWPLLTLAALPVIPILWAIRRRGHSRPARIPGMGLPLVCVLLATCLACIPIADWQAGLPKVLGMALGVAVLVGIADAVTTPRALAGAVAMLSVLALLLAGVGLVGVEWITGKFTPLDALAGRPPPLIRGVVPHTARGGIHANELAGTLVLLLPVLLAQGHGLLTRGQRTARGSGAPTGVAVWRPSLAVLAGCVSLVLLLATQSRSGFAGGGVGLALLGGAISVTAVHARRWPVGLRVAVPVLYAALLGLGARTGWQILVRWTRLSGEESILDSFASRRELWERSLYMLQDFPFTGIGPGQFNAVLHALYVPFLLWNQYVPHAHNIYLEYALELGIPGAIAFGLVVLGFFRSCALAARSGDALVRWTGLGLAFGMAGFMVYGLTDAIAPGARGGLLLWIVLGLGAAAGNVAPEARQTPLEKSFADTPDEPCSQGHRRPAWSGSQPGR